MNPTSPTPDPTAGLAALRRLPPEHPLTQALAALIAARAHLPIPAPQ